MHTIYKKTYSISYAQNKIDFENIKGHAKILYMTFGVRSTKVLIGEVVQFQNYREFLDFKNEFF